MKSNTATRALLAAAASLSICVCAAQAADSRKEARIDIASGGTVNIVNGGGSIALHSGAGHQLLVAYTVHSTKVEVDQSSSDNKQRVELLTHALPGEKPTADEARVDYDVTVPAGISVNASTTSGPITADGISADIGLSSETGQITVHNIAKSHVHVRSVTAPVSLQDVTMSRVDVQSTGGTVQLKNVNGQRVTVGTTSGNIDYQGDCSGGGNYILYHAQRRNRRNFARDGVRGSTARSTTGTVENDFPLQQKPHTSFVPQQGRSFAGTSNSGSSSVELQSFSGKIRVKKQ